MNSNSEIFEDLRAMLKASSTVVASHKASLLPWKDIHNSELRLIIACAVYLIQYQSPRDDLKLQHLFEDHASQSKLSVSFLHMQ